MHALVYLPLPWWKELRSPQLDRPTVQPELENLKPSGALDRSAPIARVNLTFMRLLPVFVYVVCFCALPASAQDVYQKPPKAVLDVLSAPAPPVPSVNLGQ